MIPELYCLQPFAVAHDPELPPLPLWLKLTWAGVGALVAALALLG
jgi:hypothetical protein